MLTNSNFSEKNLVNQNYQNITKSDLIKQQLSKNEQDENNSSLKVNIPINNNINSSSVLFNNLINTTRLANLISENVLDNQASTANNPEIKKEEKTDVNMNKDRKNSLEDNYIIIDSDEENEEINNKNELNSKDPQKNQLQENQMLNGNNKINNINNSNNTDKNKINDKDKFTDAEAQDPKKIERKLYYIRNISSNRKYKIEEKIN